MNKLNYLEPTSQQTLREGINELRNFEVENDASKNISPELYEDIDEHDAIHALFGCGTDLKGEVLAHIWTLVGTTTTVKQMHKVNSHQDHKETLREIGHFRLLSTWLLTLPKFFQIIFRARKMIRKFPISEYSQYLDRRLCDLRMEFGIRI